MVITREMIQARLVNLKGGMESIKQELHATDGAIQEAEFWLAEIDREAEATNAAASSEV